ncbi:universal stress protein [Bacillus sp. ISL-51]|uniref:universal stress protein n=1 Tax=Bacteria TaxID=2 RepID=UPI001BE588E6|nr:MULTISPECIES: universal stress protein [Bacteria]MBT2573979.1 universal stress protein [Bacillus sp. ISL-51]MBT2634690.1 universal stress protein [Bacillus sp. ISL-26]MBT2712166.1 universal stress protein [Pseudomonas sp. ISL-88]
MFHADRLIAAFDGSDDSKKALQKAIDLSKTLHATLTVVHSHNVKETQTIVDPPRPVTGATYIGGGIASVPDPLNTEGAVPAPMIYEDRTEEVIAEARMLLNDNHIDGDIDILEGDPADAIIEHADRISADLIVMGSRDQNRLKKLLFGSVSEKLSSKSDIPVLIVK